ncbi:MAG: PorT family protein [Prevotella sp.]|nr:PorT family protein [Prevotella sp.]
MKKLFMMAAAAMMAATSINAQGCFEPGTFTLHPRVGFTGALITNMPSIDLGVRNIKNDAKGGFFAGVDAAYQVNNWFEVAAGINWSQAGSGWKDTNIIVDGSALEVKDLKIETSYISVPVTANFYVLKGFALKAGVQFGFLTSAKVKGELSADGTTEKLNESCKDQFKKLDISIPVGISYEFKNHIVLDARYNFGLTKVNKEKDPDLDDGRNKTFVFTIGYKFKL